MIFVLWRRYSLESSELFSPCRLAGDQRRCSEGRGTDSSKGGRSARVLCDHLEGWNREGEREGDARGKRYGNICVCITDSLCYTAETNTPLESNYTPIKMLKNKKNKNKINVL